MIVDTTVLMTLDNDTLRGNRAAQPDHPRR